MSFFRIDLLIFLVASFTVFGLFMEEQKELHKKTSSLSQTRQLYTKLTWTEWVSERASESVSICTLFRCIYTQSERRMEVLKWRTRVHTSEESETECVRQQTAAKENVRELKKRFQSFWRTWIMIERAHASSQHWTAHKYTKWIHGRFIYFYVKAHRNTTEQQRQQWWG